MAYNYNKLLSIRRHREKYSLKYAYRTLRDNAKRRGKHFDLTFDQFKEFAIKTSYMKKKGIRRDCYHIDRIDESKGYTIDNIQVLTNRENVLKYKTSFHANWDEREQKMVYRTLTEPEIINNQNPF